MPSTREEFWEFARYAVIGDSRGKPFPRFTYRGLKALGKKAYAVDPGSEEIEGDRTHPDLGALPEAVDAAVIEVPRAETAAWVQRALDAGIRNLWLHMGSETTEALALAAEKGARVETGTCAAMYVNRGFSPHAIHRWIMKLIGQY
ncbi:MAG: CoA-binding protein [Armatimonadetes bacterium]|nr:CoA-binding protein [Armatimonadota bacterium]